MIEHILAERQEQYGDAKENFTKIGLMWRILGLTLKATPSTDLL